MKSVMDSIQSISDEARRCLADPELSREQLLDAISVSFISDFIRMTGSKQYRPLLKKTMLTSLLWVYHIQR